MTRSVYVGPAWPDGEPEPEAQSHFYCANDECPRAFGNGHAPFPNTRKYKVPGGFICEVCAEAHDCGSAAGDAAATPAATAQVEVIVVSDPDGDTCLTYFRDGRPVEASDLRIVEFHIEPGRSGADQKWVEAMREAADTASPAAAEHINETVDGYF